MSNWDATASFSWYLYQADVALLVTLEKIKEIWIENSAELEKWSLEVEWEEDFTLIENNWTETKYMYQVKDTKDTKPLDYTVPVLKLFESFKKWWDRFQFLISKNKIIFSDENIKDKNEFLNWLFSWTDSLTTNQWTLKYLYDKSTIIKKEEHILKNDWKDENKDKKEYYFKDWIDKIYIIDLFSKSTDFQDFLKNTNFSIDSYWDYKNVEKLINSKIKELKPELNSDDNTVSYIREYLTIKIKKYLQEKSKNQKDSTEYKKTIYFICNENENWFKEWIVSFLGECYNNSIIWKFLQNEWFIFEIIKNVLEKSIKESDIKYRDFKSNFDELIDRDSFYLSIESTKSILCEKIQDFWKKELERIFIVLKIVWKSFNDIFKKNKIEFLDFCYNLSSLFDQSNLKRLIVNLSIYCYKWDYDKIDNLFWKRIIIWDGNNIISNFVIDLVWNNFIDKFEHNDFIISSYNTTPFAFYNFDEKQKNNLEDEFENDKEKKTFERHVVKYKNVKICCFQCPYKMKHINLKNWDCWKTDCDLHTK